MAKQIQFLFVPGTYFLLYDFIDYFEKDGPSFLQREKFHDIIDTIFKNMTHLERDAIKFQKIYLNKNKTRTLIQRIEYCSTATFLGAMNTLLCLAYQCDKLAHILHKLIFLMRSMRQTISAGVALHTSLDFFQKEAIRTFKGMSSGTHCGPSHMKYKIETVLSEQAISLNLSVRRNVTPYDQSRRDP
ncbi:hypothetical protein WA026_019712 [Henosepilachna vigintioctopunctata]|uniref:Uncharacterized protein n=1 Tax=Henosepilachna vigintioctopunctata TaxID=420089 RepID=A0AAW1UQD6_9CUCU